MFLSSPAKSNQWNPLLEGHQSQAALASINEIAAALTAHLQQQAVVEPYLGEGAAGIAVFFAYLDVAGFPAARDLAGAYLELAIEALALQPMAPSFFSGFSGVAWAAQHVSTLFGNSTQDLSTEIDLALETYLSHSPWHEDYDLINGLIGLGIYCLERSSSLVAVRCLELIVEQLEELAQPSKGGLCWFTSSDLVPLSQREAYADGYYNLGLAHGIPGVIAFLGRACLAGIAPDKTGHLLEGAVNWLLRHRLPDGENCNFPAFLVPNKIPQPCRLAWCYGDAGVAAALLLAARLTGREAWETMALDIARRAATRDPEDCGVVDACFCHGSSGLAHIFDRFHHATGERLFANTARFWTQRTLELKTANTRAAGYSVLGPNDAGEMEFQPKFGMIEGIAGIGLSLLAMITNIEPRWDRIFMVDIPPACHA